MMNNWRKRLVLFLLFILAIVASLYTFLRGINLTQQRQQQHDGEDLEGGDAGSADRNNDVSRAGMLAFGNMYASFAGSAAIMLLVDLVG